MKKVLIIFAAIFLSTSSMAKICMVKDPTILVTHAQLAESSDVSGCTFDIYTPHHVGQGSANGGATWGASKSGNTASDAKCTVTGIAWCSPTSGTWANRGNPSGNFGNNCWCRMTFPRVGAWIFNDDEDSSASICASNCARDCAIGVRDNAEFRTAIFAPL